MIVVADSSPLVVLVNIECVVLLPALFHRIVIPPGVASELSSQKRTQGVRDFIASPPSWLEIQVPTSVELIPNLHAGETEAISLARQLRADRIILDEEQGRKAAVERHLKVIGTVGVLEAAAERGLVDLEKAFDKIKQTDFWISPKFLEERLALYRERRGGRADNGPRS